MNSSRIRITLTGLLACTIPSGFAATMMWTGDGDGVSWDQAENWLDSAPPTTSDDALIAGVGTNVTIVIGSSVTVRSVQCSASLNVSAGNLVLTAGASHVAGDLTLAPGSLLGGTGAGTVLAVVGLTLADGGSLDASGGAQLALPGLTSYQAGASANTEFRADGPGSVLALPGLTDAVGATHQWSWTRWIITASNGGRVELGALQTISGGLLALSATGADSVVDLSGLASTAAMGSLSMTIGGGGAVLVGPQLTAFEPVALTMAPGAVLDLSHVTAMRGSSISLQDGASLDLTNLVSADETSFAVSGGSQLALPGLTSYHAGASANTEFRADGPGSVLALPGLTDAVGATHQWGWTRWTVVATNGGRVELGALQTISGGLLALSATGADSVLDVGALQSTTGIDGLDLTAQGGGLIDAHALPAFFGGPVQLLADGSASTIDLSNLSSFVTNSGQSSLVARDGGTILLYPNAFILANVAVNISSGASGAVPPVLAPSNALVLYGTPWRSYWVERLDACAGDGEWKFFARVPLASTFQAFAPSPEACGTFRVAEFVANPSIVELSRAGTGELQLVLYGAPPSRYELQTTSTVDAALADWAPWAATGTMTNSFRIFPPFVPSEDTQFFRATQQ